MFHVRSFFFFFLNSVFVKAAAIPQAVSLRQKFQTRLLFGAKLSQSSQVVP